MKLVYSVAYTIISTAINVRTGNNADPSVGGKLKLNMRKWLMVYGTFNLHK